MSYTEEDAMWDAAWESMSKELYPQHKEQAIAEFTEELLQSFYLKNPRIVLLGYGKYQEANEMIATHPSASYVFSVCAVELFLKTSLLKPVVYGLVHNESLAEIVMESALGQGSLERYKRLMSKLLKEFADIEISAFTRNGATIPLFDEVSKIQGVRNGILHRGESVGVSDAKYAHEVASAVFEVVQRVLSSIGLKLNERHEICKR